MRVDIEIQKISEVPIIADGLLPRRILILNEEEIARLGVTIGNRKIELGECSRIVRDPEQADELVLSGATEKLVNIGLRMESGKLTVQGDAGRCAGMEMQGGELVIRGNADDHPGCNMRGGMMRVEGNAGAFCGSCLPGQKSGMSGGTILIGGNTGEETGARMRRGVIVVGGDCGKTCGAEMRAGTVIVTGQCGRYAGLGMKRGSLVAGSLLEPLTAGFRASGPMDNEWLRLYYAWLIEMKMPLPENWLNHTWPRFTGDHLSLGKGEVLIHDAL